jgi:hypothetical protein
MEEILGTSSVIRASVTHGAGSGALTHRNPGLIETERYRNAAPNSEPIA